MNGGEYEKFEHDGSSLKLGKYIISTDGIRLSTTEELNDDDLLNVDFEEETEEDDELDPATLQNEVPQTHAA